MGGFKNRLKHISIQWTMGELSQNKFLKLFQKLEIASINLRQKEGKMTNSVYKVIELVGTSEVSWEEAAKNAVETASKSLRELRVAEVTKLDMKVEDSKVVAFRARVTLSFKYGT